MYRGFSISSASAKLDETTEILASVAKRTIVVSLKGLTKELIERLENSFRIKICKERGCETNKLTSTFDGAMNLRYKYVKSQSDEVKHTSSILPKGVKAKEDRIRGGFRLTKFLRILQQFTNSLLNSSSTLTR